MGTSLSSDANRHDGVQSNVSLLSTTAGENITTAQANQNLDTDQLMHLSETSNDLSRRLSSDTDQLSGGVTSNSANNDPMIATNTTLLTHPNDDEFSVNLFGYILYPLRWITPTNIASWLGPMSSLAMIIGCVMPYVPQYTTIHKAGSCAGFSTFVCLTLLIANILRIAFWFGHWFELPLLIQSIIMILAQILLLELCVRVKRQATRNIPIVRKTLFSFNLWWFWRWTDLASYLEFLFIISALLGCAVYLLLDCKPFIEALGYCALVTESMLGLPQVIRNYRKHSVMGMSLSMVVMWLAGDTFKTGYFIANAVPYQFWLCGLLQISIDLVILGQVCFYRQAAKKKEPNMSLRTTL